MKRKKLSDQQTHNMQKAKDAKSGSFDKCLSGTIVTHLSKKVSVLTSEGVFECQHSKAFDLCVGDNVDIGVGETTDPKLIKRLERTNELYRICKDGSKKTLAANIDVALVVVCVEPEPWPEMLAQYLTHLEVLKIPSAFILNKIDKTPCDHWLKERFAYFKSIGIPCFETSCKKADTLVQMKEFIKGKRCLIVGPSGVGKSSLVNEMLGSQDLKTQGLSRSQKGQHTTSVTQLYQFESGTQLIDSPGIRQMALEQLTIKELQAGFFEFKESPCRFKDCDHLVSQGCALPEFIEKKQIPAFRYQDYRTLYDKFVKKQF